jgi:glucose-1-phosphate thymidylyltransferase
LKIGCLEEVALRMGFIDAAGMQEAISRTPNSSYRDYLERVLKEMILSRGMAHGD